MRPRSGHQAAAVARHLLMAGPPRRIRVTRHERRAVGHAGRRAPSAGRPAAAARRRGSELRCLYTRARNQKSQNLKASTRARPFSVPGQVRAAALPSTTRVIAAAARFDGPTFCHAAVRRARRGPSSRWCAIRPHRCPPRDARAVHGRNCMRKAKLALARHVRSRRETPNKPTPTHAGGAKGGPYLRSFAPQRPDASAAQIWRVLALCQDALFLATQQEVGPAGCNSRSTFLRGPAAAHLPPPHHFFRSLLQFPVGNLLDSQPCPDSLARC